MAEPEQRGAEVAEHQRTFEGVHPLLGLRVRRGDRGPDLPRHLQLLSRLAPQGCGALLLAVAAAAASPAARLYAREPGGDRAGALREPRPALGDADVDGEREVRASRSTPGC